MLDSHQHFWKLSRGDYGWMGDHVRPLLRDFLPHDLAPLMRRTGMSRTILVQAAESDAETDFLLDLARNHEMIAGVVGWADMDSDGFAERLAVLCRNPLLVGLRPMLQDLPDDAWILRPRVLRNLALLARTGLTFDVLCFPRHLPHVVQALETSPTLTAVIDHLAKPDIRSGTLDPWRQGIAAVSKLPDIYCKMSGMVTEASPDWTVADLEPYVGHVVREFGAERLLFGSDWPVCTLAASYGEVVAAARTLLAPHFGPAEINQVFSLNGRRAYRLSAEARGRAC